MENFPDKGLYYEQARTLAKRHAKGGNPNLILSAIRQADLHEKGSGKELLKEIKTDFGRKKVEIQAS